MTDQLNPEKILQTGLAFWASKTLLSAIEMGLFTELARGPERFDALERAPRPALPLGARLSRRARRARLPAARRRHVREHARDRSLSRSEEAVLRRRHPRDGEPSPVSVLGPPHRGASHRTAAERGQGRRPGSLRNALRRSGAPEAVPRGDDRHQPRRQHDDRARPSRGRTTARSSTSARRRAIWRRRSRWPTRTSGASGSICRKWRRSSRSTSRRSASRTG